MANFDPSASLQSTSTETEKQHVCRCTHCCDSDFVTEEDDLKYSPTRLPVPCRQSPVSDAFSPETRFIEKPIASDDHLSNEKQMARRYDNEHLPATNLYLSVIPEQHEHSQAQYSSNHDRSVPYHPSGGPPPHVSISNTGDALQPLVSTNTVKRKQRQKRKAVASFIFLLGLLYLVAQSVNNLLYRHQCRSHNIWNYQEPDESLLESTLCFPCSLVRQELMNCFLKQKTSYSDLHIVKTIDNKFHCCLERFGHVKWMVNLMKTAKFVGKDNTTSDKHVNKCLSHLPIRADSSESANGSHLKHDRTNIMCDKVNVTQHSLIAAEEGLYIIYITVTMHIAPPNTATESNQQAVKAHLHSTNYSNTKCIWMETLTKDNGYKPFEIFFSSSFYVITNLAEGEQIFSVFSHPSYIYDTKGANQIGVIKI
ncbi:uncharacterized protein LOC110467236 [Mizuhopecten yessoensis]|uniref:Uncharacterized protein n=1 Tax=Mizuhopecten yessoensis TaxID=6573 RepID=A0A210R1B0_MIZYE|nr:uncharacterized protein LOC110467236 [Mizuhopecten yessoensis]OWF54843.1 hypothetical protein KP79_PYT20829 [Mizuhopecten yessoensis]